MDRKTRAAPALSVCGDGDRHSDLSEVRYRAGLVSYLEVVESERTALEAERQSSRITGQRLVTSVQLIKALGGGWSDPTLGKLAAKKP